MPKATTQSRPRVRAAAPHFTVRRIANANPRHARTFHRVHRRLVQLALLALLFIGVLGGIFTIGHTNSDGLLAAFNFGASNVPFQIGGTSGTISGNIGDSTAAAIDGPGLTAGLDTYAMNYSGNKYGSAIGMIAGWTNFVLPFVSVLAIAALVYAGFLYITAFGNEDQTGKAKNIIIWVVIGIVIIVSAYALVNTVMSGQSN
jgi:hypothetical protein